MYRLQPYNSDFAVVPNEIMYRLLSYHPAIDEDSVIKDPIATTKAPTSGTKTSVCLGPINQADPLIQRLKALERRLDTFIKSQSTGAKRQKKPEKETANRTCSPAKRQVISTDAHSCSQLKLQAAELSSSTFFPSFVDARTASTNAAIREELTDAADLKLTLRDDTSSFDKCWLGLLSALGAQRGVEFYYIESNEVANGKVQVKVTIGREELRLECPAKIGGLRGELEVWKCLGSLLGLYTPSEDRREFGIDDKWLLTAKKHHEQAESLDSTTRLLGVHLAANDFLRFIPATRVLTLRYVEVFSGSKAVGLSDVILRSFYRDPQTGSLTAWQQMKVPNNVQLWAKRVDDALN